MYSTAKDAKAMLEIIAGAMEKSRGKEAIDIKITIGKFVIPVSESEMKTIVHSAVKSLTEHPHGM